MDAVDFEELHARRCEFAEEFALLVRKYVPEYPASPDTSQGALLDAIQDCTSCFNPYVWSAEITRKALAAAAARHA